MNLIPEEYEWIQQYLKGKLTEEENAVFESRLEADVFFKERVATEAMLNTIILEKVLSDIRKKVGADLGPPSGGTFMSPVLITLVGLMLVGVVLYFARISWLREENKNTLEAQSHTLKAPLQETISGHEVYKQQPKDSGEAMREVAVSAPTFDRDMVPQGKISQERNAPFAVQQDARKIIQRHLDSSDLHAPGEGDIKPKAHAQSQEVYGLPTPVPCTPISFEVKTVPSCRHKKTGSLEITPTSIQGGVAPYTYRIDDEPFGNTVTYADLAAGTHRAVIKDSKGCFTEKLISIAEKPCIETKDYAFNPERESWKFPFDENESGSITITSQRGNILYESRITNGNPAEWHGRAHNGESLHSGTYLYVAILDNGEMRQGYIIILH